MKALSQLLIAYLTLFTLTVQIVKVVNAGTIITADTKPAQCVITTDDKIQVIKDVGSVWHTNNWCVRHSCELDEDGNPHEKLHEETCVVNCKNEYEYRPDPQKCCGTCVKTKCLHNSKLYEVGDSWHTDCTILECTLRNGEAMVSAYTKTCPPVPTNCPQSDLYRDNCCTYCRQGVDVDADRKSIDSGLYPDDKDIQDKDFYKHHPCVRDCKVGAKPMVCKYTFVVEWYETLSNACFDCPSNMTDCRRPHCITGDGVRRSITVVNRMMPGPSIEVCLNDTIMVDVKNHLLGESTTLHWHGLHQRETPYMDGVPHVSQCPIQPHTTFRYTFAAVNPGTHFWHSHTGMQRGDGCFGPMIIRKPREIDPHGNAYDFDLPEHKLLIQDWTHQPGVSIYASHYHSVGDNKPPNILVNGRGRYYPEIFQQQTTVPEASLPLEITPKPTEAYSTLMEDETTSPEFETVDIETTTLPEDVNLFQSDVKENMKMELPLLRAKRSNDIRLEQIPLEVFTVAEGFKYRFRSINAEFLNCPVALSVDNHTLTVINSDGFDVEAINVTTVVTYAGERFDFIIHANQPVGNYWIRLKGLMDCDERFTSAFQVAILHYQGAERNEPEGVPHYDFQPGGIELNSLNMGPGYSGFVTINELKALEQTHSAVEEDQSILKKEADYKFFVYYDFYPKDNPDFHPAGLYGFNEVTNGNPVLTPQLNHITMTMPSLPLMPARDQIDDSMFCNETTFQQKGIDCRKDFCKCHHVLQVPLDAVVELILVDEGVAYDANHPFHLHGNAFRVIGLDRVGNNVTIEMIKEMDRLGQLHRNFDRPPLKDTVTVPDGGYTIIRFKADNPGYWLLHCHIEFHAEVGMALVIKVGEHNQMVPVPKNFPQCSDYIPDMEDDIFVTTDSTERDAASSVINRLTWWSVLLGVVISLRPYFR